MLDDWYEFCFHFHVAILFKAGTIMNPRKSIFRLLSTVALLASGSASAFVLPAGPCNGNNCLQEGDFQVYSLALMNLQAGGSGSPTNGQVGFVSATPGQIGGYTVIGLNGNNGPAVNNGTGIDNAYNTPGGNGSASTFSTLASDTANGPLVGDSQSWQATTAALRSALGNNNLVAFFAMAEGGNFPTGQPLLGSSMLIWAKASLVDTDNLLATKSFYLQPTGTTPSSDPLASGLPANTTYYGNSPVDPNNPNSPWVFINGAICVTNVGNNFAGFPDISGNCPTGSTSKSTNTGQNNASFALYNATLDALVHDANSGYDIFQIDWEMAYINGDGETAWIQPFAVQTTNIPEPSAFSLLGLALLGLGLVRQKLY